MHLLLTLRKWLWLSLPISWSSLYILNPAIMFSKCVHMHWPPSHRCTSRISPNIHTQSSLTQQCLTAGDWAPNCRWQSKQSALPVEILRQNYPHAAQLTFWWNQGFPTTLSDDSKTMTDFSYVKKKRSIILNEKIQFEKHGVNHTPLRKRPITCVRSGKMSDQSALFHRRSLLQSWMSLCKLTS